jgi:hypothetical protein
MSQGRADLANSATIASWGRPAKIPRLSAREQLAPGRLASLEIERYAGAEFALE